MNAPKIKLALCIRHWDMPEDYQSAYGVLTRPSVVLMVEEFFAQPTQLVDRAICETNVEFKQLLPYIVVTNQRNEIFTYYRGGAGEESRLHGSISIGLGGHVDILPHRLGAVTLHALLASEARRELAEEIGVRSEGSFDFIGAIIDPTNDVGQVHIGLLTSYRLDAADLEKMALEPGMIEQGEFRTLLDLRRPEIYDRLENWSKAVVDYCLQNPDWCVGCTPENCPGCTA